MKTKIPEWAASIQQSSSEQSSVAVNLYNSKVKAGFPTPVENDITDVIDLNDHLIVHPSGTYFVIVSGDSMQDIGIYDKDMLIVDRCIKPQTQNVVVAAIDGELTVKKLHITQQGNIYLLPANHKYPAIEIKETMECVIWGVVTHAIHSFNR